MKRVAMAALCIAARCAPSHAPDAGPVTSAHPIERWRQTHSSAMVATPDGHLLAIAHPDADRVTFVDPATRALVREVALSSAPPARDPATQRFDPAVAPRAVAMAPDGTTVYTSGQRSGRVYAIDVASGAVRASAVICSEPVGTLVSHDGARVYVACSQDDRVVALRTQDLGVDASVATPRKPWTLAWGNGDALMVTHLLGPGVSSLDPSGAMALRATFTVPDGPPSERGDARVPHGEVRGIYDAAIRPGTHDLWVLHMMLGTDTAQPALDFQRTVFPAISVLNERGAMVARMTVRVAPGDGGAFGDVVSAPHALAFTPDGTRAFVADTSSEDILVIDARRRVELSLLRPLPGHLPEAVVLGDEGNAVYVDERGTEDVAVLRAASDGSLTVDGRAIASLAVDPMPAELRLGQKLFYSANSDDVPVTRDHWVACSSCHLEGRSDAVTWRFAQGPRDTPSNAGGMLDTGFLFRTGARTRVQDYWRTMNMEQGGHFTADAPAQAPLLDALAAYVNHAIPIPVPPTTDAAVRARGEQVFAQVGCVRCHSGPAHTDSGRGNTGLDLAGGVVLHDVGTCNRGVFPDVSHADVAGHARTGCAFDTPALRGLVDSAPYLHDGSAPTLDAVLAGPSAHVGATSRLPADDRQALLTYLRSL